MAEILSKKSHTQLKLDLFMKSHSEQSKDTTEITSQKQTGDAGCTSSAIDTTEELEESMQGPSHLSNLQSKKTKPIWNPVLYHIMTLVIKRSSLFQLFQWRCTCVMLFNAGKQVCMRIIGIKISQRMKLD